MAIATEKESGIYARHDHIAVVLQGSGAVRANQAGVYEELLVRCALKDERAFAELYRICAPKLFAVAIRITRRREWAEEVLQETFVNIWNHAGRYDGARSAPMTWMTAIARNRALDWLRRPREEEADDSHDELLASIPDEHPGPEELLRRGADARRLAECLFSLSSQQQRAITLAFFYGLSHREIAAKLERPLGTVKTWIRRGLEQLRVRLEAREMSRDDSAELCDRLAPVATLGTLRRGPHGRKYSPES